MHKDAYEGLVVFANALLRICISAYAQQVSHGYHLSLQSLSISGIKIITSLIWNAKNIKDSIKISIQFQATIPAISFDLVGVKRSGNIVFLQNKTLTPNLWQHFPSNFSLCIYRTIETGK